MHVAEREHDLERIRSARRFPSLMTTNTIPEFVSRGQKICRRWYDPGRALGNSRIRAGFLSAIAFICAAAVAGCAGHPWPDEPGVPVALSRAANGQADDAFLTRLTADRRAANLPAPLVTPRHQTDIRAFAEDLQAGKLTAVRGPERDRSLGPGGVSAPGRGLADRLRRRREHEAAGRAGQPPVSRRVVRVRAFPARDRSRPISARCSSSPSKAPSRSPNRRCEA